MFVIFSRLHWLLLCLVTAALPWLGYSLWECTVWQWRGHHPGYLVHAHTIFLFTSVALWMAAVPVWLLVAANELASRQWRWAPGLLLLAAAPILAIPAIPEERCFSWTTAVLGVPPNASWWMVRFAEQGDENWVVWFLDRGVPVDAPGRDGCTALVNAAGAGHAGLVETLLARGAGVNASVCIMTPLTAAAFRGNRDLCDRLLAAGADPRRKDADGWLPADAARSNGHIDLAEHLGRLAAMPQPERIRR